MREIIMPEKKIVVIKTSGRAGSNSSYAARVFCDLVVKEYSAATIEVIDLWQAKIERYSDQRFSEHPCYPEDDFIGIMQKVLAADVVVVFSPIYWSNLAPCFMDFQTRWSEALRRSELHFSEKMHNKIFSYVMVSASDPVHYASAFWTLQRSIHNYSFVKTRFVEGLWFVADEPFALEKQSAQVRDKMHLFLEQLELSGKPQFFCSK